MSRVHGTIHHIIFFIIIISSSSPSNISDVSPYVLSKNWSLGVRPNMAKPQPLADFFVKINPLCWHKTYRNPQKDRQSLQK
jgi:hypothetical protein